MSVVLIGIALITVFFTLLLPLTKWYKQRVHFVNTINKIPGPKAYPIIGTSYLFFGVKRNDIFKTLNKLRFEYPNIARSWLGPSAQIEVRNADYIETIISASRLHLAKAWYYKGFVGQWLGNGLLISDGAKWHSRRKIITPTFHFTVLDGFCDIFADKSQILVDKLAKHADTGRQIDVYPYITRAALDIIADAAMGTSVNAQDDLVENDYVKAVYQTTELIVRRMLRPWLRPQRIYDMTEDGRAFAENLKIMHGFTRDVIQRKKQQRLQKKSLKTSDDTIKDNVESDLEMMGKPKKRLAFLDLLLEENNNLSEDDIREEVDTFMFEGHDTTTAGIAWTLLALGVHPEWQERVHDEMVSIFQGSNRGATVQDFSDMKVLDRVIKETLRLFPSVPIIGRTLSEQVQLGPYTVPTGTTVNIHISQIHRDEAHFPDPARFDPDRFLPDNCEGRHPYAYIPFSAGARNCIGQKFAVYEEKSLISSIVRNYRFKAEGNMEEVEKVFEIILRPIHGIPLVFEKR